MRVSVISDIHMDVWRDREPGNWLPDEADVHVLAGDISNGPGLEGCLRQLLERTRKPVVYVCGNHEYHYSNDEIVWEVLGRLKSEHTHFFPLENSSVEILGQRFLGATLWYQVGVLDSWVDFTNIQSQRPWDWIDAKAKESAHWLTTEVRPGDVVVTHMLPHYNSVSERFQRSPTNKYFVHALHGVVRFGGAKLWVHGHTHDCKDYVVGDTRVVCNPRGYPGEIYGNDSAVVVNV